MLDGDDFNFWKGWVMFTLDQPCWVQNGLNKSSASTRGLWTIRRIKGRRRGSWLRPQGTPIFWWVHHPPQAIRHLFQILETHHFYKEHQRTMERSTGEQHYRAASLPTNDMNAMTNLVASSLGVLALVGVVSLLDERFWLRPNQGFRRVWTKLGERIILQVLVVFPVMGNVRCEESTFTSQC